MRALLRKPSPGGAEAYAQDLLTFLDAVGSPNQERDLPELRRVCAEIYRRGLSPKGFKRQFAAIAADGDRTALLGRITAPTLVLHGLADPLISPRGGRATAKAIPNANFIGLEGMGHDLPASMWASIADHVRKNANRADISLAKGDSRA